MRAVAPSPAIEALRVLIAVADPQRAAALAQGLRDLGHFVVRNSGEASVILADNAPPQGKLPAITLGLHNPTSRGRLPRCNIGADRCGAARGRRGPAGGNCGCAAGF